MSGLERLEKLYKELGYDVSDSLIDAEIQSICQGIEECKNKIDKHFQNIFFEAGSSYEVDAYIEMMGQYIKCDAYQFRNRIRERMSGRWGLIDKNEFVNCLRMIGYRLKYEFVDGKLIFNGMKRSNLIAFGDFLRGWVPIGVKCKIGTLESSFDQWDDYEADWDELDIYGLDFDVIESMEVMNL